MFSACVATVVSSPLNYVRNIQYAVDPTIGQRPEPARVILRKLWVQGRGCVTVFRRVAWLQRQLRLGWGTARVGFGMAFSEQIYNFCARSCGVSIGQR